MRGAARGLLFSSLMLWCVWAAAYVTDLLIYAPPADYLNPTLPGVGTAFKFTDPVFNPAGSGEFIWRITDARNTPRVDGVAGNTDWIQHEYSTTSPFNQNNSFLLLIHQAYFALYDGSGRFVRNLLPVCASCAPRWSRSDPSSFSYLRGTQMYQYNADTDVHTPLGSPLPYDALIVKGEDDLCFDGDHRVGFGRRGLNYFVYIFSLSQARVISERLIGGITQFANLDSGQIAPDDIVIVSYNAVDRFADGLADKGIWAFDLNLSPLRQVFPADGHHDVGRDNSGSPVLVTANSASYQALPNCVNGLEKVNINNPSQKQCLLSTSWTLATHISIPGQGGFAIVSTYAPGDPIYGGLSRKEEGSPSIISTGGAPWNLSANPVHSGGKAIWSDNDSSQISYSFYGRKVQWIAYEDASSGIAQVTLDGQSTTVDLYSSVPLAQQIVYSRDNLVLGFHQLTIDVTTNKNPASSGTRVWVDALDDDTPWTTYTNEILQVALDGSEVRRLAHHRSRPFDTYYYAPKASVSRDAARLVFGSNWGDPTAAFTNYADVYMMSLDGTVPAPDFSLTASPISRTISPGENTSFTTTVTPQNGFTGSVALSVGGLPSGAVATFSPTAVTGSGSSVLNITTNTTVSPGTYPLTITGAFGSVTHSVQVSLMINAAPDFTLTATPATQTIVPGGSTSFTASVSAVNNFSGTVAFSVSGLPAGASATFAPTEVSGTGASTLSVTTTSTVAVGSYALTITGTSGSLTRNTSVALVVNAAPDFTLTATPATQTIVPGGSTSFTASVSAVNNFSGTVAFSVSGLPAGASASFVPQTVTGSGSSTLSITSTANTAPGTYTLIIASVSGGLTHTASVSLNISNVPSGFSITATPASQTVRAGNPTTYTISVIPQGNFTSTVTLSVSGLPADARATFNPSSISEGSGSSTLRITPSRLSPSSTLTLTIRGTGAGITQTATVVLIITARFDR